MTVTQQLLKFAHVLTWEVTKMELEKVIGVDDSSILVAACQHANIGTKGEKIQPEDLFNFLCIGRDPKGIYDSIVDFLQDFKSEEYWRNMFWDSSDIEDKVQEFRLAMLEQA